MSDKASSKRESPARTILVAASVSLVCSIVVATAAVTLRPKQIANRLVNQQRVILQVAGLYDPDTPVAAQFAAIESHLIDLESGRYVDAANLQGSDVSGAQRDNSISVTIPQHLDIARLGRRASQAPVYLIRNGEQIRRIILPVTGTGLWSTLKGYVALEADTNTVAALRFYEHAETPGLGDQIDRAAWLEKWRGKKLYDANGVLTIRVVKGPASAAAPAASHEIDGLSGATLTGNGVTNLVHYWFGEHGYAAYLARLREES